MPPLLARSLGRAILKSLGIATVDKRNRLVRRLRIDFLNGSSAFSGYGLNSELIKALELLDIHGNKLSIDGNDSPCELSEIHGPVHWSDRSSYAA